jgi:hypothetical protein
MNLLNKYNEINCLSDKESYHNYISKFYSDKLSIYKNKKIKLLEIGIQYGHSIKLWESFFDLAEIHGLDIYDNLQYKFSNKVKIHIGNAYSKNTINFFKQQNFYFDIIIDDGPHCLESQAFVMNNYIDILNTNGILIIEDIYEKNLDILINKFSNFKCINLLDLEPNIPKKENNSIILYYEKIIS